jgi:hypothetical protein
MKNEVILENLIDAVKTFQKGRKLLEKQKCFLLA